MNIKYDGQAGAWTDGNRFVKGSIIRKHTLSKGQRQQGKGRVGLLEVLDYWRDIYGVNSNAG